MANRTAYDEQARKLAGMFAGNFQAFANKVSAEVRSAVREWKC
jgi:ATP-dependent phosphoenolpyruvate carboxykinase